MAVKTKGCLQWFKDTNLKANHNWFKEYVISSSVVSNGSKILIWKQITTHAVELCLFNSCLQWFKDTNLKANHNWLCFFWQNKKVVSNGSKILIWKQITTHGMKGKTYEGCLQWFKDTNLKANHNLFNLIIIFDGVVSNGSKILIWKQITTTVTSASAAQELSPMVQRY